jgi:predicted AlkP superfamily pyrophosphatase or phosphodiesterase
VFPRRFFCLFSLVLMLPFSGFAAPVLLVSLDGFRWDYCEKYPQQTPNLRRLRETGASAAGLIPVFPSNTFPNHYSIVTGLRPVHHGIINNHFFDPALGCRFASNNPTLNREERWWGGEPIWITAVRQGKYSACYFWPGSEAPHQGLRPNFWVPYDYTIPFERRVAELLAWMKSPTPPAIVTFYFEETNSVGHNAGPDSAELAATIGKLDQQLGQLLARAKEAGIEFNVVVVSDHGMAAVEEAHEVSLDDLVDLSGVQVDFDGPVVGLRPLDGDVDRLMAKLSHLPKGLRAFRKEALPAHLFVGDNPRQPPVWIVADPGWHVEKRGSKELKPHGIKGDHGYDPQLRAMHGILIVNGPAFRGDGYVFEETENIHIYNLLCAISGLSPAPNDGDERLVKAFLK